MKRMTNEEALSPLLANLEPWRAGAATYKHSAPKMMRSGAAKKFEIPTAKQRIMDSTPVLERWLDPLISSQAQGHGEQIDGSM